MAPSQPNPIKKFFNISSRGPDQDEDMGSRTDLMLGASIATYHPSNGVNSNGDIYIFGGDASVLQGPLIIDGKTYMHNYPGNSWF